MKFFQGVKCVFTCLLLISACQGSGMAQTGATQYGLHMDLTWNGDAGSRATWIARATQMNVTISRNSLLWHQIEQQQGVRDWSRVDAVVNELQQANIEPLFVIYGSPSWANGVSTSTDSYYSYVPTDSNAYNTWVSRYQNFVAELATRYKGKVKKYELWNEQNEHFFWKPQPNADQYATWYRAMYSTMKQIDPDLQLALGGMAGLAASGPTDYNGNVFLKEMYSRGIYPDIVAVHPYALQWQSPDNTIQWNNNFTDIQLIYNTMTANGQGSKPVWATEWGWPTDRVDETTQANYVLKSLNMIATMYPFVTVATYFLDYDRPTEYYFGLYDVNGRMKASGASFRDFAATHKPATVQVTLTPGSTSLTAGGSQQFTASVSGANNKAVTWSLSSAVGSLSNSGLYTAPSSITSAQSVRVTATSVANPSQSASATVTLNPTVAITITPGSGTISAGQAAQFAASVSGTTNTAVTWSLSGAMGNVSATGLYTAPAASTTQQSVQIVATSSADNSKKATATITVMPLVVPNAPVANNTVAAIRVRGGSGSSYTDPSGNVWSPDSSFSTNNAWGGGYLYATPSNIANTSTMPLYQTQHYQPGTLQYQFSVPNGTYAVTLKFAEIFTSNYWQAGQRVFNIAVNGTTMTSNFDVIAAAGLNAAIDKNYTVNVTDGQITLQFITVTGNAFVNAIQIVPVTAAPTVKSVLPAENSTGVPLTSAVTATFSKAMGANSITTKTFTLVADGTTTVLPATVSYDATSMTATLRPQAALKAGWKYTATVTSGALDAKGNAMSANKQWSFTASPQTVFLSDLSWTSSSNGWGPVERNMSNGEWGGGDGRTQSIQGVKYAKGLGVHSPSEIHFNVSSLNCSALTSDIGIDDETSGKGSVTFQVLGDGSKLYDSGVVAGGAAAKTLNVGIAGVKDLGLVVALGPNGMSDGHSDWANARLSCRAQ